MKVAGRSLAKFLSWVLLVLGLTVGAIGVFMVMVAVLFLINTDFREQLVADASETGGPAAAFVTTSWSVPVVALIVILASLLLFRLRKVVVTVERGDPFHADNPRNLRIVALLLAAIELCRTGSRLFMPDSPMSFAADVDGWITAWLSVLIVFVLAEIFREGARLRRDADLTV